MPFDTSKDTIEEISEFRKSCLALLLNNKIIAEEIKQKEKEINKLNSDKNTVIYKLKEMESKYKELSSKAYKEGITLDFYSVFLANIEKTV